MTHSPACSPRPSEPLPAIKPTALPHAGPNKSPVQRRLGSLLRGLGTLVLVLLLGIVGANLLVAASARGRLYSDVQAIPGRRVGMVLGTSKYTSQGRINAFYQNRIDAAAALYRAGKVDYLILSGDNSTTHYDEPSTMRADLLALGIPKEHLRRDYAGFRTLDSVVRAQKVFGQNKYTVISQPFHNERAIYLARSRGQDVIGFNAADVGGAGGRRVQLREYLARVAAVMDVVLGVQPRFLGDPEPIE